MSETVSVIIPSRNERYLQQTVTDLLTKAEGPLEVIVVLDGGDWPDSPLDHRATVIRHTEPQGMRPSIMAAATIAAGAFLLKCDAHCSFAPGFDTALKADCGPDWLIVPTRHSLNGPAWTMERRDYNYSTLTYPFLGTMYGEGFHAVTFGREQNKVINAQRADVVVDDILGAQGSCWFTPKDYFLSFPPLDHAAMYFYQESQETMFRVLARGGRCVVNKATWYAHFHKGKDNVGADGRPGRGFFLDVRKKRQAEATMTHWCLDGWPAAWRATRSFDSIIEQHWWLIRQMQDPRYAWPADWSDWEKHRAAFKNRSPEQIPAHT